MLLNPSYCLPSCLVLICWNILRKWCNVAVEGRARVTCHVGCSNALPRFTSLSFYARSLLSLVRRTRVGWKVEEKAHESEQLLKQGRERRTERTLHLRKRATVVFHATSVRHMPPFSFGSGTLFARRGMKGVGCVHVMFYMYNATHTLASFVSFQANGLWLHIFTCYMHTRRMFWLKAHGQPFRQATDARSGARRLLVTIVISYFFFWIYLHGFKSVSENVFSQLQLSF